jgi:hypothetical protein
MSIRHTWKEKRKTFRKWYTSLRTLNYNTIRTLNTSSRSAMKIQYNVSEGCLVSKYFDLQKRRAVRHLVFWHDVTTGVKTNFNSATRFNYPLSILNWLTLLFKCSRHPHSSFNKLDPVVISPKSQLIRSNIKTRCFWSE